jgi:hypothetical protein
MKRKALKGHATGVVTMSQVMEMELDDKYTKTETAEDFLVYKGPVDESDPDSKCMLFYQSAIQRDIARHCAKLESDGTFKTAPAPFKDGQGGSRQIVTTFAELKTNVVVPVAFALLPDKKSESYQKMWELFHSRITCDGTVQPAFTSLGLDFEVGPKNEFVKLFPGVDITGCFFHWRQALRRQLAIKGALKFYNHSVEFQTIFHKMVALAFVPTSQISEFASIIEQEWEEDCADEAGEWCDYFFKTYVGVLNCRTGNRKQPKFAHKTWSKYREVLAHESLTSNGAEAWNKSYGMRSDVNVSFWGTLDSFVREEALAVRKFREQTLSVNTSSPISPIDGTSRQILQRDKNKRLFNLVSQAKDIPQKEYLNLMSSLLMESF